jgi:hypothetical protein
VLLLLACAAPDLDVRASVHPDIGSIVELEWAPGVPARAEYGFDEGEWLTTPVSEKGRLLLLGVPYASTVSWRLILEDTEITGSVDTDVAPEGVPEPDAVEGGEGQDESRWFLTSIAPNGVEGDPWTVILDRAGRLVWARRTPDGGDTFAPRIAPDGASFLIDYNSWWGSFDGGATSAVQSIDIEGRERARWDTPGLIHPFTVEGEGRLVWSAIRADSSGEDLWVMGDSGPELLFDCNTFVQAHGGDTCRSNAVTWDPTTGHYLYSLYSLETVIELDAGGTPVRWFGHLDGAWAFADADTTFWWQHGAHFLPDGHLLLSTRASEKAQETVAREYALEGGELVQVWSFGEGEGVYAPILGEARRLDNGNTLENYGGGMRIREATPEGEVVWDVAWDDMGTMGCTWPITDLYAFVAE